MVKISQEAQEKIRSMLDSLQDFCKENKVELYACSCYDTCNAIEACIHTDDGYIISGHFGINSKGELTNGYSNHPLGGMEIIMEYSREIKEQNNDRGKI